MAEPVDQAAPTLTTGAATGPPPRLTLARHLARDAVGVRAFLAAAVAVEQPVLDQLVGETVPHYTANDLLRRLTIAGEVDEAGWRQEARQGYRQLLQQQSQRRLERLGVGERPREKALDGGLERLSDAELLALLLRTGSASEGVLELAQRLLEEQDGLLGLAGCELDGLLATKGLGAAKATEVAAAFEVGRRLAWARRRQRPELANPEAVVALIREELSPLPHEEFWCLPLDPRSRLIGEPRVVSKGDIDGTDAGTRPFFRLALKAGAGSAIAVHNHPSGGITPSTADRNVTRRLAEAGRLLGVELVDHLIIGDGGRYCSLRREEPGLFS